MLPVTIEHVEESSETHLNPTAQSLGIYQTYPLGVLNPAFTGMFLWDFSSSEHLSGHLNEYKICKFHSIKGGIVVYGSEIFVFAPISNNDMQSYLKILFCGVSF